MKWAKWIKSMEMNLKEIMKKERKIHRMYSHFIAFQQHQIYVYTKMGTGESKDHLYSFTTKVKWNIFVIALKYVRKSKKKII